MAQDKRGPTQRTQPKKGKPVEIPVPKRSAFDRLLKRAAKGRLKGIASILGTRGVRRGLAYDVGMHVGTDTAYLLHRGYRVVAIEANPELAQAGRDRFAERIGAKQLTIIEAGIADRTGEATFYVAEHSDWSSFKEQIASRSAYDEITVPTRTFSSVLEEHGMPTVMKIDIEGHDALCLDALSPDSRPNLLVVELFSADTIQRLTHAGFREFKVIDQARGFTPASPHFQRVVAGLPRFASQVERLHTGLRGRREAHGWRFETGSSGPIDDAPGRWLSADRAQRLADRATRTWADWFDVHAR